MNSESYFISPKTVAQKKYEALRAFFVDKLPAKTVAEKYGYKLRAFTSIVTDFRKLMKNNLSSQSDPFFVTPKKGRKLKSNSNSIIDLIIEMRKKYYSISDIKITLNAKKIIVSEKYIYNIIKKNGFARLPKRSTSFQSTTEKPKIKAEKAYMLDFAVENFSTNSAGIFSIIPYIEQYGISEAISKSSYPETNNIDKISSILSFVALKISNIRRYSADDLWCMDRGLGFFAKLNVLPKASWYSSYSHRVTKDMNRHFLKLLHNIWQDKKLLTDTVNLDFVTIPYWGDDSHFENNWSGKRGKALPSILSVLAQEPDSGIIDYGDCDILHKNEHAVVLEFLDFYKKGSTKKNDPLKYLVFDSKFTNYQNIKKLDESEVKFITIRRRGKNIVDNLHNIPAKEWKTVRVMNADGKGRTLKAIDQKVFLKGYNDNIRQISIKGHGKIKPAIIITNDFDLPLTKIIRKYSRRWLVEKTIAEQTDFFHLNRVSSSMVIKVDFDLTMTILAHNLYRLFAMDLDRYSHLSNVRLYEKFITNGGEIKINEDNIEVKLKKKRDLPKMLDVMKKFSELEISWLENKKIKFSGLSYS